jgi:hypothetical protein
MRDSFSFKRSRDVLSGILPFDVLLEEPPKEECPEFWLVGDLFET